jgi:hypothetical protein
VQQDSRRIEIAPRRTLLTLCRLRLLLRTKLKITQRRV